MRPQEAKAVFVKSRADFFTGSTLAVTAGAEAAGGKTADEAAPSYTGRSCRLLYQHKITIKKVKNYLAGKVNKAN